MVYYLLQAVSDRNIGLNWGCQQCHYCWGGSVTTTTIILVLEYYYYYTSTSSYYSCRSVLLVVVVVQVTVLQLVQVVRVT